MRDTFRAALGWLLLVVIVAGVVFLALTLKAHASEARPCGLGGSNKQNRQLAKCLSRQPGIRVDRARAVRIGNCESGFNAAARSGPYHGIYQLERPEFNTFQHQGPQWVDQEFRRHDYGIHSARGNILATFAHVHGEGWDFIGTCD